MGMQHNRTKYKQKKPGANGMQNQSMWSKYKWNKPGTNGNAKKIDQVLCQSRKRRLQSAPERAM